MNKTELIRKIEETLNKYGITEKEDSYDLLSEDFISSLEWLPVENLSKMLKQDISNCTTFEEVYQLFGRCGALRFKPYAVQQGIEAPSMCIRRDRFLHMPSGYYFQVSSTVDGVYDYGTGAYNTNFLTCTHRYDRLLNKSLISYMLWWSAMIDVGFTFDNFRMLFEEDKSVLNDFIKETTEYWNCHFNYSWSDIEPYIVFSHGEINKCVRKMYHLCDKKDKIFCYLAMGKRSVQVQLPNHELLTITIPNFNTGIEYDLNDSEDLDDYVNQVQILERNHYIEMITVMALALCSIKISFMGWHFFETRKQSYLLPINAPHVVNVKTLNDIYGQEPDEF